MSDKENPLSGKVVAGAGFEPTTFGLWVVYFTFHSVLSDVIKCYIVTFYRFLFIITIEQLRTFESPNIVFGKFLYFLKNHVPYASGVKRVRWHDLRHTYASLLISKNLPIKYIQKQMGHGSIQVTLDRYGHLMPDVNEQAISVLNGLFSDGHNLVTSAQK